MPLQTVFLYKELVLVFTGSFAVMNFLVCDVLGDASHILMRDREGSVSAPPCEPAFDQAILINPM
jgi:hypothetical protein